jgi:hypothetical protein
LFRISLNKAASITANERETTEYHVTARLGSFLPLGTRRDCQSGSSANIIQNSPVAFPETQRFLGEQATGQCDGDAATQQMLIKRHGDEQRVAVLGDQRR